VTLILVPLTEEEFAARRETLAAGYADSLHRSRGLTPEQARERAAQQVAQLLPEGLHTEGTLLFNAIVDGRQVGWIWIALPDGTPERPDAAWIYDIEIEPEHRGKGYGRALMEAAERELVARGVDKLALNVFGFNTPAIRLYESLGFEVTAQQMAKPLRVTG
jgi:ribosomal protein S18 acetylase RimI-like enzyme